MGDSLIGRTAAQIRSAISAGTVSSLSDLSITSTATEINKLDGFTGVVADLIYAKDLRATGVTSTEFDYLDGVTSNIQTQLNGKQASGSYLTAHQDISGKANLSEWANFRSENSVSGWSSIGGQTTHVLDSKFNPCGSSSGSAVAVASGIVDIAIGTETNGSISCPSSVNGIVGFKPTVGLVSRTGIVPISSTQDTAGPMGISVDLVAKTLEVIAGYDPLDASTYSIPADLDFNFSKDLISASIEGKRFAILQSNTSNELMKPLLDEIKLLLSNNGAILVEIEDTREYPGEDEYFLLKYM